MSDGEPEIPSEASATLARLGLSDLHPVYQPVVDVRDGRVVGYEALIRGDPASELASPAELFAAAHAAGVVAEFDAAFLAAAGIPTVMFGASGEGAHAVEEWVSVEDTVAVTNVLVLAAQRLCG